MEIIFLGDNNKKECTHSAQTQCFPSYAGSRLVKSTDMESMSM